MEMTLHRLAFEAHQAVLRAARAKPRLSTQQIFLLSQKAVNATFSANGLGSDLALSIGAKGVGMKNAFLGYTALMMDNLAESVKYHRRAAQAHWRAS